MKVRVGTAVKCICGWMNRMPLNGTAVCLRCHLELVRPPPQPEKKPCRCGCNDC